MVNDSDKSNEKPLASESLTPGQMLTAARQHLGLSEEEVAKELYMTVTRVKSLESDDYRYMASDTFTRGYLRAYAQLLKIEPQVLLQAYDQLIGKPSSSAVNEINSPAKSNSSILRVSIAIAAVLVIVWLLSVWFLDNRKKRDFNPSLPEDEKVLLLSASSAQIIQSASSKANEADSAVSEVSDESRSSTASYLAVAAEQTSLSISESSKASSSSTSTISTKTTQLDVITLRLAEECWVEVSDSRGDVLVADLHQARSNIELKGVAPFDVKLGNARAATILLNGETFEFNPRAGSNVLTLKVERNGALAPSLSN